MMPLRTWLKPLASLLFAGFACTAMAAPQHANGQWEGMLLRQVDEVKWPYLNNP